MCLREETQVCLSISLEIADCECQGTWGFQEALRLGQVARLVDLACLSGSL